MLAPRLLQLNPAKLVRSKWTACTPVDKEKHFMVISLVRDDPAAPVVMVTMEALHSGRCFDMAWRELRNATVWRQGWT